MLREVIEKGVINVARYYHYKIVHIGGKEDDINDNVRKELGIIKATNAFLHTLVTSKMKGMIPPQSTSGVPVGVHSRSTIWKRLSSSLNALLPLPPNKHLCSTSLHTDRRHSELPNQIHHHVILHDYRKNINKASSRVMMLAALEGNIKGMRYSRDPLYAD